MMCTSCRKEFLPTDKLGRMRNWCASSHRSIKDVDQRSTYSTGNLAAVKPRTTEQLQRRRRFVDEQKASIGQMLQPHALQARG